MGIRDSGMKRTGCGEGNKRNRNESEGEGARMRVRREGLGARKYKLARPNILVARNVQIRKSNLDASNGYVQIRKSGGRNGFGSFVYEIVAKEAFCLNFGTAMCSRVARTFPSPFLSVIGFINFLQGCRTLRK